jgi:tetratricopeptide (TPR) repeat protein
MATKKDDIVNTPDPFRVFFEKGIDYLTANRLQAYVLAGILVLIIVGSSGWYLYRSDYENSARSLYDQGLSAGMKGTMDRKDIAKIYRDVVAKYPHSRAAIMSNYLLGNLYYNLNDLDAAIRSYREFLQRATSDNQFTSLGYSGLGYCYEAKRDYKNALSSFEKALTSAGGSQFEGMNYRNGARIYEALNNQAKAKEYYQKALAKNTDPSQELLLRRKISTLG